MASLALAMERSYRQYCVLDDPTLARLYQNQRQQYLLTLIGRGDLLPDPRYRQRLESLLAALDKLHCENSGQGGQASA